MERRGTAIRRARDAPSNGGDAGRSRPRHPRIYDEDNLVADFVSSLLGGAWPKLVRPWAVLSGHRSLSIFCGSPPWHCIIPAATDGSLTTYSSAAVLRLPDTHRQR